jgi:glyoxylase-like metal-dependent hydrolase (beta-lactamase superfamily II)
MPPDAPSAEPVWRHRPGGFDIRPACQPEARLVRDGVWVSEGLSNSYLVVTPEGRVVVNTGMGFEAPVHKRNYDAVDGSPVRAIVLTQGHVDHVGGVDLLREHGTEIVAHAHCEAHQADDARIAAFRARRSGFAFAEAIARANAYVKEHLGDVVSPQSRPTPTVTFEDEHAFDVGGRHFELYATPGGETLDSLVVWMPEERICFTGNLSSALFGHFPNLVTIRGDRYREAPRFVASLDRVAALEPDLLLPGHGGPVEGRDLIQRELARLRAAVGYVHEETVRGMNAGKDVHTLMAEIALPPELEVGEGYGTVRWSVRAIWETYAGWFHGASTTELYATPASSVRGDLVELAGADPLVARARAHLDAGRAVEALHLTDVVLGAEPEHRGALEASRDAHAALEAESENFWLSSWLRREIAALDGKLASLERELP